MKRAISILVIAAVCVATSTAGNRKVLVLPVDGNVAADQRANINTAVNKLAKDGIDGDVSAGDTTFNETATAVGCAPDQPGCADTVMTTLSVDELVWGDAKSENGSTTLTVHRAAKGEPARQQVVVVDNKATGDSVYGGMAPLFARDAGSGSGSSAGSNAPTPRSHTKSVFDTTERKLGAGLAAGSVIALAIGVFEWRSESDMQDEINAHQTSTLAQLQDLHNLEDRAATKALWGNVLFGLGIALGGASGYFFWKDYSNRSGTTVIAPAPTEDGQGVKMVIGGRW